MIFLLCEPLMSTQDATSLAPGSTVSLRRQGAWLGAKIGCIAACLYLVGFLMLGIFNDIVRGAATDQNWSASTSGLIGITLIFGIPIGVLPATGIGALTGFIIAWLLGANSAAFSR